MEMRTSPGLALGGNAKTEGEPHGSRRMEVHCDPAFRWISSALSKSKLCAGSRLSNEEWMASTGSQRHRRNRGSTRGACNQRSLAAACRHSTASDQGSRLLSLARCNRSSRTCDVAGAGNRATASPKRARRGKPRIHAKDEPTGYCASARPYQR
jgi:hypothetical protein